MEQLDYQIIQLQEGNKGYFRGFSSFFKEIR